jgi:hypothetical protein
MSKDSSGHSPSTGDDDRPNIVQLYLSGKSIRKISKEIKVSRDTVRTTLLTNGIRLRHSHPILHEARSELDHDVALLLGLHAGDGYLSDGWGISIAGDDLEMGKFVVSLARDVLGVEPFIEIRKDNCFVVKSGKEQVRKFFGQYGFTRGRKAGIVQVPRKVMQSEKSEIWVGFLRGAFSSDGSFWYDGNSGQCRFEVSSPRFRDGFIELARRLGYQFRAYSYIHHGGHNKLPLHLAYLGTRHEVIRWMEQVGSISDTHLERYRQWRLRIGG